MNFQNPFALYTGEQHDKLSKECTRRIRRAWRNFVAEVKSIRKEYEKQGATDTESRELMCDFVAKNSSDLI